MSKDEYEVGYRKPPKHSRWPKGRSGNPRGRPKGSLSFGHLLEQELNELVTITENGTQRRLTKREVAIKATVAKAMKGDHRALKQVLDFAGNVPAGLPKEIEKWPVRFTLKLEEDDSNVV